MYQNYPLALIERSVHVYMYMYIEGCINWFVLWVVDKTLWTFMNLYEPFPGYKFVLLI